MPEEPTEFDVAVIGGGHAGIEAALAAARLGGRVAVVTHNLDTIGQMSCNPSIGGLAKGHIVREIDALGGAMGLNTDATALQYRMLNAAKGPSVRAPRAQCDKSAYRTRMKWVLETTPGVQLFQGDVEDILVEGGAVAGVRTSWGQTVRARRVVLCSGTFMRGLLHVGMNHLPGGRLGCAPSGISACLERLGFPLSRFKTGTSPRVTIVAPSPSLMSRTKIVWSTLSVETSISIFSGMLPGRTSMSTVRSAWARMPPPIFTPTGSPTRYSGTVMRTCSDSETSLKST